MLHGTIRFTGKPNLRFIIIDGETDLSIKVICYLKRFLEQGFVTLLTTAMVRSSM